MAEHRLIRLLDRKTGTAPLHINPGAVVLLRGTETKAQWQLG